MTNGERAIKGLTRELTHTWAEEAFFLILKHWTKRQGPAGILSRDKGQWVLILCSVSGLLKPVGTFSFFFLILGFYIFIFNSRPLFFFLFSGCQLYTPTGE